MESHINHRAVAVIVRLFAGRWRAALDGDARFGVAGQNVQHAGDNADDQRTEQGVTKTFHMKERQQRVQQTEHQRVDDEHEQAQRQNQQRQSEHHEDGADEGVQYPQ